MPHDINGKLLSVGDQVLIRATVKEVYTGEEYCNVQVETVQPMYPGENKNVITLNAKQVELDSPAAPPEPSIPAESSSSPPSAPPT